MALRNLNRSYPGDNRIAFTGQTGIAGDLIPGDGEDGPALLYSHLPPDKSEHEYQCLLTQTPSSGALELFNDSSFIFEGATDGQYFVGFDIYEDGVFQSSRVDIFFVGVNPPQPPDNPNSLSAVSSAILSPVIEVVRSVTVTK